MIEEQLIASLLRAVENLPMLAFALYLWSSERTARIDAEKRERAILRQVAEIDIEE